MGKWTEGGTTAAPSGGGGKWSQGAATGGVAGKRKERKNLLQKVGDAGLGVGQTAVSPVLKALEIADLGRRAAVAGVKELDDLVVTEYERGRDGAGDGASLGDLRENFNSELGAGDLTTVGQTNKWVGRAVGLAGDIALDPLSYVTFGATKAATGARAVRVGAKDVARDLASKGQRELAETVLRRNVGALTAEQAAQAGIKQGATIGLGTNRVRIPGTAAIARGANAVTGPVREAVLTSKLGRAAATKVSAAAEAVPNGSLVDRLEFSDALDLSKAEASGIGLKHRTTLANLIRAHKGADTNELRRALEGEAPPSAASADLRRLLDDVADDVERVTGRTVPRLENYLPHQLTREFKQAMADGGVRGRRSKSFDSVLRREKRVGTSWFGVELETGSIDEMEAIAQGVLGPEYKQVFRDDPWQIANTYIRGMEREAQRQGLNRGLIERGVGNATLTPLREQPIAGAAAEQTQLLKSAAQDEAAVAASALTNPAQAVAAALRSNLPDPTKVAGKAGRKAAKAERKLAEQDALRDALYALKEKGEATVTLVDEVRANEGVTYQPKTGARVTVGDKGYGVSLEGAEEIVPADRFFGPEGQQLTDDYMARYVAAFEDPKIHLGVWHDVENALVYLDLSEVVPSERVAKRLAIARKQEAYFDYASGETQRVGARAEAPVPGSAAEGSVDGPSGAAQVGAGAAGLSPEEVARAQELLGQLQAQAQQVAKIKAFRSQVAAIGDRPSMTAADAKLAELDAQRGALTDELKSLKAKTASTAPKPREVQVAEKVVAEAAPTVDHAQAAVNGADDVAALNAARLEQIGKLEGKLTKARASELEARREADHLFAEASRLKAERQTELAAIATLEAMVKRDAAEATQLSLRAAEKRTKAAAMRLTHVVPDARSMYEDGLRQFATDKWAEPWVVEAVAAVDRILSPPEVGKFVKLFDSVTSRWKAYSLLSPGFHERNFMGGMFNNSLAGMNPKHYFTYAKASREFRRGGFDAVTDPEVRRAFREMGRLGILEGHNVRDLADVAGVGTTRGLLGDKLTAVDPTNLDNVALRTNARAAKAVERELRGPLFIDVYLKTNSADRAMEAVVKYHFDYSDLTTFEQKYMKRLIPFYTWTRKNFPLQVTAMAATPGRYTRYLHAKRNIEAYTTEDEDVPSYYNDLLAIRTPFHSGENPIYFTPDLPFRDVSEVLDPNMAIGALNPIIKTPLEARANKQFFTDVPFTNRLTPTPTAWAPFVQLLRPFSGKLGLPRIERAKDGTWMMTDKDAYKIEQMLPLLGRMRRLAPSEERYQTRATTTWLSFVFGLGGRTLDEASQFGEVNRQVQQLQGIRRRQQELGQ